MTTIGEVLAASRQAEQVDAAMLLPWVDQPMADPERFELALLLAQLGEVEAVRACAAALDEPARSRLLELLRDEDDTAPDEDDDAALVVDPVRAGPTTHTAFLEWFGGRRDIYATQWFDEGRRRGGYKPVEQPLTTEVVRRHFEGRITLGQYPLFLDGTVSFAAVDLDLSPSALAELRAGRGEDTPAIEHSVLARYLRQIVEAAYRLGLSTCAEDSGGRGAHVWFFFRPRRPARAARQLLALVVEAAGTQPPDVGVEIFPSMSAPDPVGCRA